MVKIALVLSGCLLATTLAFAQSTTTNKTPTGKSYLQTPSGQALYVYDNDKTTGGTPGAPTCNGQCATYWPPFMPDQGATPQGDWSAVARQDGSKQWAYKGRPVYTFVRDKQSGKVEGDGFNGNKWHLAEP
jgi:predicted lipoprotein with Yx(FWY)xxD motif